ncbi:M20/M25/M40 family metallo-hydrolase [Roseomonas marmotae]|uniref:M20/M25/M40 family metallo-hydrolase n=1 Tax=Roseomonas marmotae TaxID=2768161 RepID=A0ABS3K945_9PROT|nr:M20/M25/M40 family metallo-hydrolase [Roseomonas marmotae]MBO1073989.1 M20/M25/M40 family metallo-hydrolase [Roseomonas marmotae]QTI78780.1 M20/M25/M40 family metallo-hydrolase [Roseomonas marmotae]
MDLATPSDLSPNAARALALPFTAEALLASLRPWVEQESPTYDAGAVNAMISLAMRDMALLGAQVERIPGRMGLGDCIRARFAPPGAAEGGILILAHLDTVHPVGTLTNGLPFRVEGPRAFGPGIYDMKGGTVLALRALEALAQAGIPTSRPVTVLLTSDEEIGSPSTRDLIEAEAARHQVVLVPEPGRGNHGVVTGRYAIARFKLRATGRPSHAGAQLSAGRSAVREMAKRLIAIEEMTTEACTYSVGVIHGGQWVNCVPTFCDAQALTMAKRQADLDAAVEKMLALNDASGEVRFEVERGVTRPVWEPDAAVMELYGLARRLGAELGLTIGHESAGGGSDGNFTGAMGIPTLDGLGVLGGNAHTLNEHILLEELVPRARLLAALLASV